MPPARRQHARHSACLKANTPSHLGAMDEEVLFYSDGKKAMAAADDGPSGSDKGQIYGVLAKLIFTDHVKYGPAYAVNAKKFCDAVCNRIGTGKYKKIKASFGSTGAGVMPAEGTSAKNLLDAVLLELPWYMELDAIWHSNPSMAAKVHSSRPGVDHAGNFYSLVQPHGGAGPSMYYGQWPSQTSDVSNPSAPHTLQDNSFAGSMYPPAAAHRPPLPSHPPLPSRPPTPPLPSYLPPPPLPPHSPPYVPDVHLPGLPSDDNDSIADNYGPLHSPLGDALDHVEGGDDDDMILDDGPGSPSPVAGKKRQLPSSPSPPPSPPVPFVMPSRTPASTYNNRLAFGVQKLSSRGGQRKIALVMSHSTSMPSSTTRNTSSLSEYHMSPTPQTSLPNSAGSSKKKAKSDVSQQVEQVRDEIESLHSSVMSHHEGKHQHYIAKLEAKSEHNRDLKKYDWLHATQEHEASQAAVSHQRLQEAKDAKIRLRETDIRVHQAHSKVLDKEAETLCLKIQFHQMMQASKASSDGGTG
ncbi:hypothetical protein BD769DRAFT_1679291 [Suillus cothurnatus]|nr:hypothetical protein BD769DRAFT_1679291 [Suillus cothurnatus]